MDIKRLETARLFHRFGFGPKPGEFEQALKSDLKSTRKKILSVSKLPTSSFVSDPIITDLGRRPAPNTAGVIDFATTRRRQIEEMQLWWLDLMVVSDNGLIEKMTWFWHGHWATSIQKVDYPLPMYQQNKILREYCLSDFTKMTKAMVNDAALQLWLDGPSSTAKAPNENLARELLELFTLGVNRYTEQDVKEVARVLTGYQVVPWSGQVIINPIRQDKNLVTIFGSIGILNSESLVDILVQRKDCQRFIPERIWYRFISSSEKMPDNFEAVNAFASRDISKAVSATVNATAISNPKYELVKSPVEWFVAVCRALELIPSKLASGETLINHLNKLGQVPFLPPNVGGWPTDQGWLSSATALYRVAFANWLIQQSRLRVINEIPVAQRTQKSADWLGVPEWSERTKLVLDESASNPAQFALLALCSPDYIVSR
ncbi:MAG: DUF1800 family protein [Actinobacteria bacterium]|nr:DUF1800 family protein [Actinomycetota bacterium]NDF43713.1 DUF1800 family protein [Actinomycetota bacterium]NDF90216.1 DUF1800 family protein [Actinomycetota bacterium]